MARHIYIGGGGDKILKNLLFSLSRFQYGFRPVDSTVNQLLYLVHQIYLPFKQRKEVKVVYLDNSRAFDRVWHRGLLIKLER